MIVKNFEKNENNTAVFTVESDKAEFEKAVQSAYLKNKSQIYIPGFRKGKAPRQVIEGMYGREVFYQDALDELAPAAYELGVKENELRVVGAPNITDVQVTDERTAAFTFSVELYPVVTLGQYKGVEAEKPSAEVSEEEVDKELESVRKRNARKLSVDDRPAQLGDTAKIDFDGYLDGVPFEGGKGENYPLELGSNSFVPGFEDQIVGMQVGEEKDINITFPQDYVENLAGKDVVFKVKLHELTVDELPELDDEFAGDNGFDTLEEYKASIRADLEKKAAEKAESEFRTAVLFKAAENMTVTIPQAMITEKTEELLRNYASNYGMDTSKMPIEEIKKMMGVDDAMVAQIFGPAAERQVRGDLLIEAVIEAENIEVTEEETREYLEKVAESVGAKAEEVEKYFGMDFIAMEKKKEKATELIVSSAVAKAPEKAE